ncbi:uncharacterized protein LOC117120393 [Anneissia japonica]|uniref:uncharacterized protein LOC117120393 n=1 Tax=Anneissia japonica TaxID=1529436 RepID=UPI001425B2A6|nr:uncharacterized protein LOC117120393 [Anneissia japonica]
MPNLQDCPKCDAEIKKIVFSGLVGINVGDSEIDELKDFEALILYLGQRFNGAAPQQLENEAWKMVQLCCFPEEVRALKAGSPLPTGSRLKQLSPEWDKDTGLLRVGGRLREANAIQEQMKHPIILDPKHHITKILIRHTDVKLLHPGPERVLAELRRRYWILRGREVVKGQQRQCQECQRWRANPSNPQMRDLPAARLQLFKPVFHCTGIDCFGPMHIKVGRRTEKRWGIVYKCMTVGAVHLELLESMDTDAFLLSLRRFISWRGQPAKIYSDCGTNFKSGDKELRAAFDLMTANLREELRPYMVEFHFNPPNAPHFGGLWERAVRSVKTALKVAIGEQLVAEPVLLTLLVEVEGILNSRPLGYTSTDPRDANPVTPNVLLMGRLDPTMPQVVYTENDLLTKKRWKHSQVLMDHFWRQFIRHYLPAQQIRQKW